MAKPIRKKPRKPRVTLFPEPKKPKRQYNFRLPDDVADYLDGMKARDYKGTEAAVHLLRLAMAVEKELGEHGPVIERQAKADDMPVGKVVARLAKAQLLADGKLPHKK